jgi:hypothetical protein
MKKSWFLKMLATFDYHGLNSFYESLAPSFRYCITKPLLAISLVYPGFAALVACFFPSVEAVLGISGAAFITMIIAFAAELTSGLMASYISGKKFTSFRLSRFTFKVCIYLIIIAIPHHWSQNFKAKHMAVVAAAFDWLQSALIMQVAFENIVSILENMAVITGKDKTELIDKIKSKVTSFYNG